MISVPKDVDLHIVVVEDNQELREILVAGLGHFGFHVRGVADGTGLDQALCAAPADVVILDLGLPGEDGISIAQRLRDTCDCGIVMVTGRGQISERVVGREAGADLYFVKPVDISELRVALLNLAQRLPQPSRSAWRFTSLTSTLFTPSGIQVRLTAQECIVMQRLMQVPGTIIPRSEIFGALGQKDDIYADKRLEAMISRLRSKVRAMDPCNELPVRARHNLGYAFLSEVEKTTDGGGGQ